MPLVQVKLIEGVFDETQKKRMIHELTEAMVRVEGENMRKVTWVIIDDNVKPGDWGIGGKSMTPTDVAEIAAGAPV